MGQGASVNGQNGQAGHRGLQLHDHGRLLLVDALQLGELLVLVPAHTKVDLRWLSLVLSCPKKRLRLAGEDECLDDFGAVPGRVPPLPLRPGVRVLCDPRLRDATELGWDDEELTAARVETLGMLLATNGLPQLQMLQGVQNVRP